MFQPEVSQRALVDRAVQLYQLAVHCAAFWLAGGRGAVLCAAIRCRELISAANDTETRIAGLNLSSVTRDCITTHKVTTQNQANWHRNSIINSPTIIVSAAAALFSTSTLIVPPTRLSTVGDRAFPVVAARVWNGLSPDVTSAPSLPSFKRRLKTELFARSYPDSSGRVWLSV